MMTKLEQIIETYIKIRDVITKEESEFRKRKSELKSKLSILEDALSKELAKIGTDKLSFPSGTAFRTKQDFVSVFDWDAYLQFLVGSIILDAKNTDSVHTLIATNQAIQMLNKSISKTVVKEFLSTENRLPPGVKYEVENVIQVRRS